MGIRHKLRRKIQFYVWDLKSSLRKKASGFPLFDEIFGTSDKYDPREEAFLTGIKTAFAREHSLLVSAVKDARDKMESDAASVEQMLSSVSERTPEERTELGNRQTALRGSKGAFRLVHEKLERCHAPSDDVLRMQYREIMCIYGLTDLWISGSRIEYQTDTLYGQDYGGLWRRIGRFEISFDLVHTDLPSFRWVNRDSLREHTTNNNVVVYHGPPNIIHGLDGFGHVSCAGSAAASFIRSGGKDRDYPTLMAFSIRYPECVGSEARKNVIELWPLVRASDVPGWYIERFGE